MTIPSVAAFTTTRAWRASSTSVSIVEAPALEGGEGSGLAPETGRTSEISFDRSDPAASSAVGNGRQRFQNVAMGSVIGLKYIVTPRTRAISCSGAPT